jgi:hypothetical protein
MKITGEEIRKYPEFHAELCRLCQENLGPDDRLNCIDILTNEENWKDGIFGFNIRYHFNGDMLNWRTIDSHNSNRTYKQLSEELKIILRDKKLKELGI